MLSAKKLGVPGTMVIGYLGSTASIQLGMIIALVGGFILFRSLRKNHSTND